MRIASLDVERFGVWEQLHLPYVSPGLNVFYGPNEAGKTTLMQFIRSSLYGCADDERARYIQMVLETKKFGVFEGIEANDENDERQKFDEAFDWNRWVGGSLAVKTDFGDYRLQRRYIRQNTAFFDRQTALEMKSGIIATGGLANWSGRFYPLLGKGIAESLIVSGPDGARLSDYFVKTLVNNVDEATFNNVFAIGLDELQRLGTLDETDAAQMLYRLSVGLDRVSLVQVLHQLIDERNEVFDVSGKPAILESLLAQREKVAGKSNESAFQLREYSRILTEQRELQETIRQLQEKIDQNARQKRIYEIARKITPIWDARIKLRAEIEELGQVVPVGQEAVQKANELHAIVEKTRERLQEERQNFVKIMKERDSLAIDENLWLLLPRIELLQEDSPRLSELNEQIEVYQTEIDDLNRQLYQEEQRLKGARNGKVVITQNAIDSLAGETGLANASQNNSDSVSFSANGESTTEAIREVEDYREPAKAVKRRRRQLVKVQEQYKQVGDRLKTLTENLDQGLTSHGQKNLTEALEKTSELVSGLRRRLEIAQRLNETAQYRKELERRNAFLVANQSLPTGVLAGIGAGVALGGFLFGLSLFKTEIDLVWGVLGLIVAGVCLVYKSTVEKKNYAKLEENQRRLGMLIKQIEKAKEEASVIDARFPAPGQSVDVRLQKAKADFAFFEKLVPIDSQWKETNHHFQLLESRLEKAKSSLHAAKKAWIQWLKIAGLPNDLKPSQIQEMLERVDIAEDLRRRLDSLKNELDLFKRERRGILDRLEFVLASWGTPIPEDKTPTEQIAILKNRLDDVRQIKTKRRSLLENLSQIRQIRKKIRIQERVQRNELDIYLARFGAKSIAALIQFEERYQYYLQKVADLESTQRQLIAGIADFCDERTLVDLLDDSEIRPTLPELQERVERRLENLTEEHRSKVELSGRMDEQLASLAAKKDSIRHQFDRCSLDIRINEMALLWKSRAVACRMMEDIRKAYEKERQPETLREASKMLSVLTGGRYIKIWTPLGEDTLYIDDSDGRTLEVSALSRGAREQLFIAIRLALATSFEKHGVQLPLILDDVLVNFDNRRAWAAAKLLKQFAQSGRQIFLFTCHKHICQIFLNMKTPVFVLPSRDRKSKKFGLLTPPTSKSDDGEIFFNRDTEAVSLSVKEKPTDSPRDSFSISLKESLSFDDSLIRFLSRTINSPKTTVPIRIVQAEPQSWDVPRFAAGYSDIAVVDQTGTTRIVDPILTSIKTPSISLAPIDSRFKNVSPVRIVDRSAIDFNVVGSRPKEDESVYFAAVASPETIVSNRYSGTESIIVDKNDRSLKSILGVSINESRPTQPTNETGISIPPPGLSPVSLNAKESDFYSIKIKTPANETVVPVLSSSQRLSPRLSFPPSSNETVVPVSNSNDDLSENVVLVGGAFETIKNEPEPLNLRVEQQTTLDVADFIDGNEPLNIERPKSTEFSFDAIPETKLPDVLESDADSTTVSSWNLPRSQGIQTVSPDVSVSRDSSSSKAEIDILSENRRKATLRDVLLAGSPRLSYALKKDRIDEPEFFLNNEENESDDIDVQERLARRQARKRQRNSERRKKHSSTNETKNYSLGRTIDLGLEIKPNEILSDEKRPDLSPDEASDDLGKLDSSSFDILDVSQFDDAWADVLTSDRQESDQTPNDWEDETESSSQNDFLREFFTENEENETDDESND